MLSVRRLSKTFPTGDGRVGAVRDLSFEVEAGAFFTLLGPSGCGKTTTLRCIAGLERPDGGEITLGGQLVDAADRGIHLAPYERPIGMVFQSYAIWPHMTVFENVAYPLEVVRQRLSKKDVRERVMDVLTLVKMAHLAARPAPQLSGGQQQRIALARALVSSPRLLLLDEPLSNLDAKLRSDMRDELGTLVTRLGITTLFVTHDQDEALAMSTRIAVMDGGSIVQEGSPREIYQSPEHSFVAGFVGSANVLAGVVSGSGAGVWDVDVGQARLVCRPAGPPLEVTAGSAVTVIVRAEDVLVTLGSPPVGANVFEATMDSVTFLGSTLEGRATGPFGTLRVSTASGVALNQGDRVYLSLPPEACRLVPPATARGR